MIGIQVSILLLHLDAARGLEEAIVEARAAAVMFFDTDCTLKSVCGVERSPPWPPVTPKHSIHALETKASFSIHEILSAMSCPSHMV
jgi:hypothetical protein